MMIENKVQSTNLKILLDHVNYQITSVITNDCLISATLVAEIKQSLVFTLVIRSEHSKQRHMKYISAYTFYYIKY